MGSVSSTGVMVHCWYDVHVWSRFAVGWRLFAESAPVHINPVPVSVGRGVRGAGDAGGGEGTQQTEVPAH